MKENNIERERVISEINEDILSDPSLYMYNNNCEGLDCTEAPSDTKYSNAPYVTYNHSVAKYGMLFFDKLDLTPTWNNMISSAASKDGLVWLIAPQLKNGNVDYYIVQVFVGTPGATQCLYGDNGCSRPTLHQFRVALDGRVEGIDKLTQAYLMNPTKMNDKKNDYATAESLPD